MPLVVATTVARETAKFYFLKLILLFSVKNTGKNNRFPFLDILGYLKNTHKNPKFGRVRQFPGWFPWLGLLLLCQIWDFYGYSLKLYSKISKNGNPLFFFLCNYLYGEVPPKRVTFFRLQIYKRVGILLLEVYETVGKSGVSICTDDRQNTLATLLREVGHFFLLNWKLEIKY